MRLRNVSIIVVLAILSAAAGSITGTPTSIRLAQRYSAKGARLGKAGAPGDPAPSATSDDGDFSWADTAVANLSDFGEPSIDVDHQNNMYVTAPGGAGVQMWKSTDLGQTFQYIEIGSDNGGGDSEIEFNLNDVGFTADLEVSDSAVSRSTDGFKTWEQQDVGIEQDRQWFAHQCAKTIYLVYHDFAAELELLSRSDDAGKTWDPNPVPVGNPGDAPGNQDEPLAADQGVNTFSGPIAVNQKNGDVYVVYAISSKEGNVTTGVPPFGEPQQIVVGVSHDNGATFVLHLIEGGDVGELAGVIFPWITIDVAGNVYVSYARREAADKPLNIYMSYSKDRGDNWAKPYPVNTDVNAGAHIYSTISAGDDGVVDVAWYTSSKPDPNDEASKWYVDFAQVKNAASQTPQVSQSRVYQDPIHEGSICLNGTLCILGGDRSLLDFFQVQVGPDGMANIAFANNASPDKIQRVWYARQTRGPSAGNGLLDERICGGGGGGGGGGELKGPHVHLRVSDATPQKGEKITFFTRLGVCGDHRGTNVELKQEEKGQYNTIATKKLSRDCHAKFTIPAAFGQASFRATWPKQDDDHRAGKSKPVSVTTH
ncbi:MAG: hypothetical protein QOG54_395 [Actinomycetota bacterium]|nr:hypothetical protein [Actinomycetota bacterium]